MPLVSLISLCIIAPLPAAELKKDNRGGEVIQIDEGHALFVGTQNSTNTELNEWSKQVAHHTKTPLCFGIQLALNAAPKPRVTAKNYNLEFLDNTFALYAFNGADNTLTCCYLNGAAEFYPIYIKYFDDDTKSWGSDLDRQGSPIYCFDYSTSWAKLPQSDLRVYRFVQGHKVAKFEGNTIVWPSPLVPITKPVYMHTNLPHCAVCDEKKIKLFSTSIFTNGGDGNPESIIATEALDPSAMWHPTEYKILVNTDDRIIQEYNGHSRKFEKKFPASTTWISARDSAYIYDGQRIIAIGTPGGVYTRLYELQENQEPRELPVQLVGGIDKDREIWCRKILGVVKNYVLLECSFSDNPRFLGIYNIATGNLYNAYDFKTEKGSLLFDPATMKIASFGHRSYIGHVYNRECAILKVELEDQ